MRTLSELSRYLKSMPSDADLKWILWFLDSGRDKNTGLSFIVANDGSLTEWPTFRAFLLDVLSAIDPAAAAATSSPRTPRRTSGRWP